MIEGATIAKEVQYTDGELPFTLKFARLLSQVTQTGELLQEEKAPQANRTLAGNSNR
jgi:hypothetical protein